MSLRCSKGALRAICPPSSCGVHQPLCPCQAKRSTRCGTMRCCIQDFTLSCVKAWWAGLCTTIRVPCQERGYGPTPTLTPSSRAWPELGWAPVWPKGSTGRRARSLHCLQPISFWESRAVLLFLGQKPPVRASWSLFKFAPSSYGASASQHRSDQKQAKPLGSVDRFRWLNHATGLYEEMWAPVRAWFLTLMLPLPARTVPLRMVDSGETDTELNRTSQFR